MGLLRGFSGASQGLLWEASVGLSVTDLAYRGLPRAYQGCRPTLRHMKSGPKIAKVAKL